MAISATGQVVYKVRPVQPQPVCLLLSAAAEYPPGNHNGNTVTGTVLPTLGAGTVSSRASLTTH